MYCGWWFAHFPFYTYTLMFTLGCTTYSIPFRRLFIHLFHCRCCFHTPSLFTTSMGLTFGRISHYMTWNVHIHGFVNTFVLFSLFLDLHTWSSAKTQNHKRNKTHTASPKWVLKPSQQYSVLRGRRVIIDCQAEGIPPPTHQWKKRLIGQSNDLPLSAIVSGPRMHVLENGSLAIIDASQADFGEYVCEA